MTTHSTIDRLHALCRDIGSETLTVGNVVEALGSNRRSVEFLARSGQIEASTWAAHGGNKRKLNYKARPRYAIEAAAVLIYLTRNTGGDKTVLLEAIRVRFPHHHALCLRVAFPKAAEMPANVVHIGDEKRPRKASGPKPEHPGQLLLFPVSA